MIGRVATLAWLTLVWLALLGSRTVAAALAGVAVSGILLVLFRAEAGPRRRPPVRPVELVRLAAYLAVRLVEANVQVAWAVVAPRRAGVRLAIVAVPVEPVSRPLLALLASAVTLTPGTTVVDARDDPSTLYVHALQLTSLDAERRKVLEMQLRIVRALGPGDAVDGVRRRLLALDPDLVPADEVHP